MSKKYDLPQLMSQLLEIDDKVCAHDNRPWGGGDRIFDGMLD